MPQILNGKEAARATLDNCSSLISSRKLHPCLAIITVGNDDASKVYVRNKIRAAESIGIRVQHLVLPLDTNTKSVIAEIRTLNYDPLVHGIIVQLPLPQHLDKQAILNEIWDCKDVDGFSPTSKFKPCTPSGIIRLLDYYNIPIEGRTAVICGRSEIVGKPLAAMLLERNATVTVCHSKTPEMIRIKYLSDADIIISAVGISNFINPDDILTTHDMSVLIDVGINRDENGKICGDINPECYSAASAYTPVPGGIGPMTVAMLMENVTAACLNQICED